MGTGVSVSSTNSDISASNLLASYAQPPAEFFNGSSKPYVRWWWLTGPFLREDIRSQLEWVRAAGFGGVELAWILPRWLEEAPESGQRPHWVSAEWSELVTFTKKVADELGLGCDFTFSSCWPFGGSWVAPADTAQTFFGESGQEVGGAWEREFCGPVPVMNHLSTGALERYASFMLAGLKEALSGSKSALFCDSLELETEDMWSAGLWEEFEKRFGYGLESFVPRLKEEPAVRYDYRRLIADVFEREFIEPFVEIARRSGAYARVQCHGAPTDLLRAYAAADVPESEALLFLPSFSRIASSGAAWDGKRVVSAEAFTCIYGFAGREESGDTYWRRETIADLKLLADSLFAQGVNQFVWHGMPYQPAGHEVEFYAAVHVGPDSGFAEQLPEFNRYLEKTSALMKLGEPFAGLGVYLPWEDALMEDEIPEAERTPGAVYRWEMRHAVMPAAVEGYHPLWISHAFLRAAYVKDGLICSRALRIGGILVDCEWLAAESLRELVRLAQQGGSVVMQRQPREPGRARDKDYARNLESLRAAACGLEEITEWELVKGDNLPAYWARQMGDDLLIYFAHPLTKQIRYPMEFDLGAKAEIANRKVELNWRKRKFDLELEFRPSESLVLLLTNEGEIRQVTKG